MPFDSKAQSKWAFATGQPFADEWAKKTSYDDLPDRADEAYWKAMGLVVEMDFSELEDDEEEEARLGALDPEERAVMHPDDASDEDGNEDDDEDEEGGISFEMPKVGAKHIGAEEDDEVAAFIKKRGTRKRRRSKEYSNYSTANKDAATDVAAADNVRRRDDIGTFANIIMQLRRQGKTFGRIAREINDRFDLKAAPDYPEAPDTENAGRPATNDVKCPKCASQMHKTSSDWICTDEKCGYRENRALEPEQVADFLRSIGEITPGEASRTPDLGAHIQHNHPYDPNRPEEFEMKDDCPACNWATSWDTRPTEKHEPVEEELIKFGSEHGVFTTEQAIEYLRDSDLFKAEIPTPIFKPCPQCGTTRRVRQPIDPEHDSGDPAEWAYYCGNKLCSGKDKKTGEPISKDRFGRPERQFFGDDEQPVKVKRTQAFSHTKIPDQFKNLGDYVTFILRNSPKFQAEPGFEKKYSSNKTRSIVWTYEGGKDFNPQEPAQDGSNVDEIDAFISAMKENVKMTCNCECPSCEEGNHQRCRNDCGNSSRSLKELFASSMKKPGDQQLTAGDMTKLKQNVDQLGKLAQQQHGNILQHPDGTMSMFPDKMKDGDLPLVADLKTGTWAQQQQAVNNQQTQMSQNKGMSGGTMESVFKVRKK